MVNGAEQYSRISQELMDEWCLSHQKRGLHSFISDGAVCPDLYAKSTPKICFFLKEAYSKDGDGGWSLTDWLAGGALTRMWGVVAEWTYGIRNTTISSMASKPNLSPEEKTALLKEIAIVNVKKSNGTSSSDYANLLDYVLNDRELLCRELDLLSPDVIVCGNNSSLLRVLYGASVTERHKVADNGQIDHAFMQVHGFAIVRNTIILDYYHPANQYPSIMNYYTVCSLYQQALNWKE